MGRISDIDILNVDCRSSHEYNPIKIRTARWITAVLSKPGAVITVLSARIEIIDNPVANRVDKDVAIVATAKWAFLDPRRDYQRSRKYYDRLTCAYSQEMKNIT
jgi:hypothetical protein